MNTIKTKIAAIYKTLSSKSFDLEAADEALSEKINNALEKHEKLNDIICAVMLVLTTVTVCGVAIAIIYNILQAVVNSFTSIF